MATYGKAYIVNAAVQQGIDGGSGASGTLYTVPSTGFTILNFYVDTTGTFSILVGQIPVIKNPGAVGLIVIGFYCGPSLTLSYTRSSGVCYINGVEFINS